MNISEVFWEKVGTMVFGSVIGGVYGLFTLLLVFLLGWGVVTHYLSLILRVLEGLRGPRLFF